MITQADKDRADTVAECSRCGELVLFTREDDTTWTVLHDGCDEPIVSLVCHHPRRLGVITSIVGEDAQ